MTMASDIELLLLGVVLGATPSAELGRILTTALAKRAGIEPQEIRRYSAAASGDDGDQDADDAPR